MLGRHIRNAGLLAAIVAGPGCLSPATSVLVLIDTDAPLTQELTIRASVVRGDGTSAGNARSWIRGGPRGTLQLPASFAVIPGDGPNDTPVTLFVDADLATPAIPDTRVSFRRTARFEFRPNATWQLRVFIATNCLAPATGCLRPGPCTVAARCDERGLTCGDGGQCISTQAVLEPTGTDAGMRSSRDSAIVDVRDVAAMDVSSRMDVSIPGIDVPCPGATGCAGRCVDTSTDERHCGACGNACAVGQGCVAGRCTACLAPNVMCGPACANTARDIEHCGRCDNRCPSGASCVSAVCRCPGGESNCGGSCMPTGAMCMAGVGACERSGTIVCAGADTQCSAVAGAPVAEVCNGMDDNCDGAVDEDPACLECLAMPASIVVDQLSLTGGDREFNGHGPNVDVTVAYAIAGTQVQATACVHMRETQSDWTEGSGCRTVLSTDFVATPIQAILDANYTGSYRDSNHNCDFIGGGPGVASVTCVGDTNGDDICSGPYNCGAPDCSGCLLRMGCVRVRRRGM